MSRKPGSVPRYQEIEAAIRRDIEAGKYEVGDDLPTEAELCEAHDASRFTIREALRRIEAAGYIKRHQGRGSRVTSRSARDTFVLSGPSEADVLRYLEETTVQHRLVAGAMSKPLAREVGVSDPDQWIHYTGLRRSVDTGRPVAVFDVYVRREYDIVLARIAEGRPIYTEVIEKHGLRLAHIDQTLVATGLPARFARRLRAESGEPALRIIRKFVAEDVGMFQFTVSFNPADRFHYHLRLAHSALRTGSDAGTVPTDTR